MTTHRMTVESNWYRGEGRDWSIEEQMHLLFSETFVIRDKEALRTREHIVAFTVTIKSPLSQQSSMSANSLGHWSISTNEIVHFPWMLKWSNISFSTWSEQAPCTWLRIVKRMLTEEVAALHRRRQRTKRMTFVVHTWWHVRMSIFGAPDCFFVRSNQYLPTARLSQPYASLTIGERTHRSVWLQYVN